MNIKPLRTEQDYQEALSLIEPFFDKEDELTQDELDYFDVMVTLIENYEAKHYPIDPPTPIEAIKFRMEQEGLNIKDLDGIIGKPNRVSEVFNKKRPLTLNMIRNIHYKMGISADILIQTV
ncbi:transcriptional regulator [Glaesserella parasuis]|nr:transcriptional regulator [Glaesserella parasuis]MCT8704413.1 transcriptional regulator [Glaesserella parasuis]MCT8705763.1 transcriptional regulator [Glaesserella parasuis]MCT8708894.1 transcriptional regulator [Glaesserella parasuis]MCT8710854.1 transcriptional regulator [Glaesserella parasuis]